jgi:hypothetical protein
MPQWNDMAIPAEKMREVAERKGVTPIRAYATEFDTDVVVERDAFFQYLLDPLPVLTGQLTKTQDADDAVARELGGLVLDGVGDGWRIVTVLRNHHRGLNPRVNFASATVSTEEETVYQEIYKQTEY